MNKGKIRNVVDKASVFKEIVNSIDNEIALFESNINNSYKDTSIRIITDHISGMIDFNTLSSVLVGLQDLTTAAFKDKLGSIVDGNITSLNLNHADLILTGVSEGSFVISFDTVENKKIEKQLSLLDNEINIIEEIGCIMDTISKVDDQENARKLVENYGKDTYKKTTKWFGDMKKKKISFEFNDAINKDTLSFDEKNIKKINKSLRSIKKEVLTSYQKISGVLIAIDNKKGTIILECEDDKLIKIKVLDDSLQTKKMTTNKRYDFDVIVKSNISELDGGKSSEKYEINTIDIE